MSNESLNSEELRRLVDEVNAHPHRELLALLAFDWMSRQGEGHTLLVGRDWIQRRAEERRVSRDMTNTAVGPLLDVLERGAEGARESQTIAAFATLGWSITLRESQEAAHDVALDRFVRHADWFEIATPYSLFAFVDVLLAGGDARDVWKRVAKKVLETESDVPRVRASQVMRLYILLRSGVARELELIDNIAKTAADSATRELASAILGRRAAWTSATLQLSGRTRRVPRQLAVEILRWISGWAFLAALLRIFLFCTGFRSVVEFSLRARVLHVREHVQWLGRTVREKKSQFDASRILGARRTARYAWWPSLLGATSLALGILVGGLYGFDGIRTGSPSLLAVGALIVVVGAGFDFLLALLLEGLRGHVTLEVYPESTRAFSVSGVPTTDADNFLDALATRAIA